MKYLILSDIHSNLETLGIIFHTYIPEYAIEALVCLGDITGYNANPVECIALLFQFPGLTVIRGNHDRAIAYNDFHSFSDHAKASGQWTREQLSPGELKKLADLPKGPQIVDSLFAICHGSAGDENRYILSSYDTPSSFLWLRQMGLNLLFFGHTHITETYTCDKYADLNNPGDIKRSTKKSIKIRDDAYYCINPGSLGQPRDNNPQASFAVFDSTTMVVDIIRFSYPIEKTREKIMKQNIPYGKFLGSRLMSGK
jgi:predicted phosphodiesterase